jgi:hypothetical protein
VCVCVFVCVWMAGGGMMLTGEGGVPGDKLGLVTCHVTDRQHCVLCIVGLPVIASGVKYRLLHKNGFMGNLCRRQ